MKKGSTQSALSSGDVMLILGDSIILDTRYCDTAFSICNFTIVVFFKHCFSMFVYQKSFVMMVLYIQITKLFDLSFSCIK